MRRTSVEKLESDRASVARNLSLRDRVAGAFLRLVSRPVSPRTSDHEESYFLQAFAETRTFLQRFSGSLDFRGKRILDYGCGYGAMCVHLIRAEGASVVTGVDIDESRLDFARRRVADEYPDIAAIIDFKAQEELTEGEFDLVVSKDSFQHYSDPKGALEEMSRLTTPGGLIVIGFGPLWKSPYGGAINYMTRLPWAHLLFPEGVIMRQRLRYRPDERVNSYAEIRGGFNKMTVGKCRALIEDSGLEVVSWRTNASSGARSKIFCLLEKAPGCREFFTLNLYTVLRKA